MGVYVRLVDYNSQQAKEDAFLSGGDRYDADEQNFSKIPGMPIAYWVSEQALADFDFIVVGENLTTREGMATADNDRFLRYWYEVRFGAISFHCANSTEVLSVNGKWVPYNKGGESRDWYGNNDYIVNWQNDGAEIRNNKDPITGRIRSHNYNGDYGFRKGITWTAISSSAISVRYCDEGFLFDSKGAKGFSADDNNLLYILALLNSRVSSVFLQFLSPTLDFKVGDIIQIPLIIEKQDDVIDLTTANIIFSRSDWDSFETSWDFQKHPFV